MEADNEKINKLLESLPPRETGLKKAIKWTALSLLLPFGLYLLSQLNELKNKTIEYKSEYENSYYINQGIEDEIEKSLEKNDFKGLRTFDVVLYNRNLNSLSDCQLTIDHDLKSEEVKSLVIYPTWAEPEWFNIEKKPGQIKIQIKKLEPHYEKYDSFKVRFFIKPKDNKTPIASVKTINTNITIAPYDETKLSWIFYGTERFVIPLTLIAVLIGIFYTLERLSPWLSRHSIKRFTLTLKAIIEHEKSSGKAIERHDILLYAIAAYYLTIGSGLKIRKEDITYVTKYAIEIFENENLDIQ